MRLETTLTHLLEEYTYTGLLQESLKAPHVVTTASYAMIIYQ